MSEIKLKFNHPVDQLAWIKMIELQEKGWKTKNKIDLKLLAIELYNYWKSNNINEWDKMQSTIYMALMKQMNPPKYLKEKLGEDFSINGYGEEDYKKYVLTVFADVQNEMKSHTL